MKKKFVLTKQAYNYWVESFPYTPSEPDEKIIGVYKTRKAAYKRAIRFSKLIRNLFDENIAEYKKLKKQNK